MDGENKVFSRKKKKKKKKKKDAEAQKKKEKKKDFQVGGHSGHLEFSIATILSNFLHVTPMIPAKFRFS